ncbi:MAG: hypothetical protein AAGA77_12625 [Bacteroidota bacterium]
MKYKYSICHPDRKDIEYLDKPISGKKVLEIAKNYPWIEKLKLSNSLNQNAVHYSPSLDFTNIGNGKSFCLTADYDKNENLNFSLWFNRPKEVKLLFGLLGKKEKMVVDDVWEINFDRSIYYLEHFVNGNYYIIENLYKS